MFNNYEEYIQLVKDDIKQILLNEVKTITLIETIKDDSHIYDVEIFEIKDISDNIAGMEIYGRDESGCIWIIESEVSKSGELRIIDFWKDGNCFN